MIYHELTFLFYFYNLLDPENVYVQVSHVNAIRVESCSVYYFVSVIYHELTFLFHFILFL